MACTVSYIEDVKQFAQLGQLKQVIRDMQLLMEDMTNLIVKFTSDKQGLLPFLCISMITNSAMWIAFHSLLSPCKQEQIYELTK